MQLWTQIELLVVKYWHQVGLIPNQDYQSILKVKPNLSRLQTIEKKNAHELAAFVEMLTEQVGLSGKWIHYGLTSNDVLDTTQNFLLWKSSQCIERRLKKLLSILKEKAYHDKNTLCLGRTHGMIAEPITVGYRFALWFQELNYHLENLHLTTKKISCVKILGPTGMSSHFPLALSQFVAKHLEMDVAIASSQVFGRYHLIDLINCLTNLALSIEKMAIEVRNLHRSEINELSEGFTSSQKGSSAMPHKKNPIICENICGLVRLLRSIARSFEHTNLLWHERDLTNSAIERVAIPDFFHLLTTAMDRFINVLTNLSINYQQINFNLDQYQDDLFSHKIMLTMLKNSNLDRNQAYALVQKSSFVAKKQNISFQKALMDNGVLDYLTLKQLQECFDLQTFLVNLDDIFTKIFTKN